MKIRFLRACLLLVLCAAAGSGAASASQGPIGVWKIADGTANVAIRSCGPDLCGFVAWSKRAAAAVGQQVLIDMKPNGHSWSGLVVNVVDGQKYSGRISLLGDRILMVEGCVVGGIVCGGQQWSRVR